MATINELLVKGIIELQLKGKGAQEATQAMKQIVTDAKKGADSIGEIGAKTAAATASVTQFGGAVRGLLAPMAAVFSAATITSFVKSSVLEFAKFERQLNVLVNQVEALGQGLQYPRESLVAFLDTVSKKYGIVDDDLIPALNRLVLVFGDVAAAQRGLQIASQFAANGIGTVQSNAEALTRVFQSGSTRALQEFGIQTKGVTGESINAAEAFQLVVDKLGTLGTKFDDTQAKLNDFAIEWDNFSDSVGKNAAEAITQLQKFALWVDKNILMSEELVKAREEAARKPIIQQPPMMSEPLQWRPSPEIGGTLPVPPGAEADPLLAAAKAAQAARDKAKAEQEAAEAAKKRAEDIAKAAEQQAQAEISAATARAQAIAAIDQQAERARIDAIKDGTKERLKAELDYLDEKRSLALMDTGLTQSQVEAINDAYDILRLAKISEFEASREESTRQAAEKRAEIERQAFQTLLDEQIAALEEFSAQREVLESQRLEQQMLAELTQVGILGPSALAIITKYQLMRTRIEKQNSDERIRNARAEEEAKKDAYLQAASSILSSMSVIFNDNKAMAIASAIIDTYVAANKALASAPPPLSYVLAAAAIAQGLANVQRIRSATFGGGGGGAAGAAAPIGSAPETRPPSPNQTGVSKVPSMSFDDRMNDQMAVALGRRSAKDLASYFGEGFRSEAALRIAQTPTENTTNVREGDIVIRGPIYGGRAGLRQLAREIDRARRNDPRRVR